MSKTVKTGIVIVIAGLLLAIGIVAAGMFSGNKTAQTTNNPTPVASQVIAQPVQPQQKPQAVVQPPSAKDVADQLNCKSFTDLGGGSNVGVIDAGSCYIGSSKYAIDTFASKDSRDTWLKAAEPLGVNPKWLTDTSVTYPSVSDS